MHSFSLGQGTNAISLQAYSPASMRQPVRLSVRLRPRLASVRGVHAPETPNIADARARALLERSRAPGQRAGLVEKMSCLSPAFL